MKATRKDFLECRLENLMNLDKHMQKNTRLERNRNENYFEILKTGGEIMVCGFSKRTHHQV